MTDREIEKIIKEAKELVDIQNEYRKTAQLLQQQRLSELQNHIMTVIRKYPAEAAPHNISNPCMPITIEQNGLNCMRFLENLFKTKLGLDIADAVKYLKE